MKLNAWVRFTLVYFLFTTGVLIISQQKARANKINFTVATTNRDSIPFKCANSDEIEKIIMDAIDIGAPVYNSGNYIGCYRIYDAIAYKILYLYGDKCPEIMKILKDCINKCHGDYSDTEKAWIMRGGFDKILGEPTVTGTPPNSL
jgi:hypothetical protein